MLSSANLIGKPRAVINETVEINNKSYVGIVNVHTVTVSAYVIEFTGDGIVRETGTVSETNTVKEDKKVIEEKREADINGKWISKDDNYQITIAGNIGVFSKINSGMWLRLLQKGKIKIDDAKFKNITKTGELTWSCHELERNGNFLWLDATLILNEEHNRLTVRNYWYNYFFIKDDEEE